MRLIAADETTFLTSWTLILKKLARLGRFLTSFDDVVD